MTRVKSKPLYRAQVKAYEKSVVIGATTLYPIPEPAEVALKLSLLIRDIETRAFEAGVRFTQEKMRDVLGI